MWAISQNNAQASQVIKNKWIDGFTVAPVCRFTTNPSAGNVINAKFLQLKGVLRRGGHEIEMFNTTLLNLVLLSHLRYPTFDFLFSGYQELIGNSSVDLVPLRFDFGGPINLVGEDEFYLEWQLNDPFWVTASGTLSATSLIQIDECETLDVEHFVPITKVIVIEQNQENPTYSLGDNILNLMLINLDKTDEYSASAVVNSYSLSGSTANGTYNKNDSYNEMLTKKLSQYVTYAEAQARLQKFVLFEGPDEIDAVSINLNLNSANVTAANNFILWRTLYADDFIATRAAQFEAKKMQNADKKGSYNPALITQSIN